MNCGQRPSTACRRPHEAATWPSGSRSMGRAISAFITTPGVEPTNNLAEQAIRFVVIDRMVTQGSRSDRSDDTGLAGSGR